MPGVSRRRAGRAGPAEAVRTYRRTTRDAAVRTLSIGGGLVLAGVGGLVALALLTARMRSEPESGPGGPATPPKQPPPPDEFPLLLTMVLGNEKTAERLIAFEGELHPGADRATRITKAVERLRRDRQRQG